MKRLVPPPLALALPLVLPLALLGLPLSPSAHALEIAQISSPKPGLNPALEEATNLFVRAQYSEVIARLKPKTFSHPAEEGRRHFLLASAYAKLQSFPEAVSHYKEAARLNAPYPSLAYDYGQALFATNALAEAEEQFTQSIRQKFKVAASAYYVGYSRQLRENYGGAGDFYRRIQRMEGDEDKVKQPALYQLAELEFDQVQRQVDLTSREETLRMDVIPLFAAARDYAPQTSVAEQAAARIAEIAQVTNAAARRMVNGIPLPLKPYTLRLQQEIGYDSNVITLADDALVEVSGKGSLYSRTLVLAKYQFNYERSFSFVPELLAFAQFYGSRGQPLVYQNDNIYFAPALRTKYEHVSRGAPATALFDLEYQYMLRDYPQDHSLPYYSRAWNFTFGERVKWFDTGSTTAKLSLKFFESFDPRRNSISPALSVQQNVKVFGAYDLQNTVVLDYFRARDANFDEFNFRLRHAVVLPRLFERVDFVPSLNLQVKDTMKQAYFRGTEVLVNPSLSFARTFANGFDGSLEYGFSKNFSRSKDLFQYTKHEAKVAVGYNF